MRLNNPEVLYLKSKNNSFTSWVFAFFTILSLWPFFSWKWPIIPVSFIVITYTTYAYEVMFNNQRRVSFSGITIFLIISFFLVFYFLLPGGAPPWMNYYSLFSLLFLLLPYEKSFDVAVKFKALFCYLLVPGLIVYFLLLMGFNLPYSILGSHSDVKEIFGLEYRDYGVTIALSHLTYNFGNTTLIRFSGLYDEPGLLGTICSLFLLADKFNLRKKQNIILLISGLVSISLVFYIFAIIGFIIQSKRKLFNISIMLFIGLVFYNSPLYDNYLGKRFNNSQSGSFVNDNRVSECFKTEYDGFLSSNIKTQFIGEGHSAHLTTLCDVSSYKMYIYDYGYLGSAVLMFLMLLQYFYPAYCARRMKKFFKSSFLFIALFFVSYYQRPVLFNLAFIMIFYYGIVSSLANNGEYAVNSKASG
jgi:hypothetical protein